jgi:hypothetical protein
MRGLYPVVPLAANQALGIAIMSYNGRLGFGLLADFDALPDLDTLADELVSTMEELSAAAGAQTGTRPRRPAGGRPRALRSAD